MRNNTKYPQTYLDRLLPSASCPNCTSLHVTRDTAREINQGEHILVSHVCEDCKVAFTVRYNMQYLRMNQQKHQDMVKESETKNTIQNQRKSVKDYISKQKIKLEKYADKRKDEEDIPMDSKSRKKMLYTSVSRGFNVASIVTLITCSLMISYEIYDLTINYNNNSLYNMLVIFIVMIGLLVITQLFSIIYKIIGR